MRIKIFQIDSDKDTENKKFRALDNNKVNSSIYRNVFYGDVEAENLEDVFRIFNTEYPGTHQGHSMSVSDVVEICKDNIENKDLKTGSFYCDRIGFKPIEFDTSQCEDMLGMRVLYVTPHHSPLEINIKNDLTSMQKAVDGLIEPIYEYDDVILVGNEEAKLRGMEGNRKLESGTIIAGPFFIYGDGGENFTGLTDEQVEKYMNRFSEPEDISQEEVEDDIGFTFITY